MQYMTRLQCLNHFAFMALIKGRNVWRYMRNIINDASISKATVNLYYLRLPHFRIVQKNMNDHSMEVFWGKRCTILHVILAQRRPKNKLQTSCQTFDYSRWSLKLYFYSITEYWVACHCSIAMSIIYKASIRRGHSPK